MEQKREDEVPDDDEPDEWDKRINKTGCAEENLKLQLCHADTNDWRQCVNEVSVAGAILWGGSRTNNPDDGVSQVLGLEQKQRTNSNEG